MRFLLFILCLFVFGESNSQEIKSFVSKDDFKIGERITYKFEIKKNKLKDSILYKPYSNAIPAKQKLKNSILGSSEEFEFEIYNAFSDTLIKSKKLYVGQYDLTIWDTGYFVIPEIDLIYEDSTLKIPPVLVHVSMDAYDPNKDPIAVEEIFEEIEEETIFGKIKRLSKDYWYLYLVLGIVALIVIFKIWYKKADVKPVIHKEISLKDRTLFAIEALDKRKLWEQNLLKEHYLELSSILRMYLTGRYKESFMEKTTNETAQYLRKIGLEQEIISTINYILSHSDMVKFANSEPQEIEILKVSFLAKQIVAETSPLEFENE